MNNSSVMHSGVFWVLHYRFLALLVRCGDSGLPVHMLGSWIRTSVT